jgi:2-keto-4-pentenoate hydratase/2-oxohepta-3-ene-1,7-dioic acid hydratase in catechol pathway
MRYCRFRDGEGPSTYGEIRGDDVFPLGGPPWEPAPESPRGLALDSVELLVPTIPSKIVAVGLNYRKHAEEMGKPLPAEPLIFFKAPSALNAQGRPIVLPKDSQEVHHEAELGLVIGKTVRNVSEREAGEAIFALTCFNDVTARDIQRREIQYSRCKSYDTFCCVGPWIVSQLKWADLQVTCKVNGSVRQSGRTSDMIFTPARLVSFISSIMTLVPGDIVATGTPPGVGPIRPEDKVEIEIEGIGTLSNPVLSSR